MHLRLKETPGGLPATPAKRLISAAVISVFASSLTTYLLFKFGSSELIVNDYPKLVLKSFFLHDTNAAFHADFASINYISITLFKLLALVIGIVSFYLIWWSSDPKRRKPVIADGLRADSRGMLTAQKAKQAKLRNRT